jgi:hypothetical protein
MQRPIAMKAQGLPRSMQELMIHQEYVFRLTDREVARLESLREKNTRRDVVLKVVFQLTYIQPSYITAQIEYTEGRLGVQGSPTSLFITRPKVTDGAPRDSLPFMTSGV